MAMMILQLNHGHQRSRFGSTTNTVHSDFEDDVEAVMQDLLHERLKHSK